MLHFIHKRNRTPNSSLLTPHSKGFTLIELMIVISIIAVMSAIGIVVYSSVQRVARDGKRIGDIQEIQKSLEQYYATNGNYPTGAQYIATTGTGAFNTSAYFASSVVPKDPTPPNNDYTYRTCPSSGSPVTKYVVCSASIESCGGTGKCNATAAPADGCSGYTSGNAVYCAASLSN